jgi:hypothetical protein
MSDPELDKYVALERELLSQPIIQKERATSTTNGVGSMASKLER